MKRKRISKTISFKTWCDYIGLDYYTMCLIGGQSAINKYTKLYNKWKKGKITKKELQEQYV